MQGQKVHAGMGRAESHGVCVRGGGARRQTSMHSAGCALCSETRLGRWGPRRRHVWLCVRVCSIQKRTCFVCPGVSVSTAASHACPCPDTMHITCCGGALLLAHTVRACARVCRLLLPLQHTRAHARPPNPVGTPARSPAAHGLRQHLPKHQHCCDRYQDRGHGVCEPVEEERQRFHRARVAQQQCDEQEVLV